MNIISLDPTALSGVLIFVLSILLLILGMGLWRAWLGPSTGDRFTALLLTGTTGIAMLFLLGSLLQQPALFDVAMVLALLAVVITAALTRGGNEDHG